MDRLCLKTTGIHASSVFNPTTTAAAATTTTTTAHVCSLKKQSCSSPQKTTSKFWLKYPLSSLWPGAGAAGAAKRRGGLELDLEEYDEEAKARNDSNWVMKILHVRSLWKDEEPNKLEELLENNDNVCRINDEQTQEIQFDRDSFSNLLKRVSLSDARLYAKMSYLGNLAYAIPSIKPGNLFKNHGLRLVTSSIDKKAEKEQLPAEIQDANKQDTIPEQDINNTGNRISAYAAYQIAASAASYLHSQTTSILPFKSKTPQDKNVDNNNVDSDVASLMATTGSVTAVVAAKEEVKQAVADDLNSTTSSPCAWFICDDDLTATRFFVIQGSETLASWKANLLFEPIQFEEMDVIVHRGIYEAAKGIYEQMLPEVRSHVNSFGNRARFRFTGHSLGGSLALLVNLMLLIRGEVPASSLLPVITFGSPSIMCGGDNLLRKLGLPTSHIQSVMMHRDIVPRAFSCNYPNHVAELLKAVNGNFRNHPCLNNQKLLYAPMGELLILQPDEKFSPHHDLLPSGSGLYLLSCPVSHARNDVKLLQAARMVFLNSPHPLEILSDRSSYGSGGTIQRDHDMNSYLKCVRGVIRQELGHMRKARREHRRKVLWPLVESQDASIIGIVKGRSTISFNGGQEQFKFSEFVQTGKKSVKRFSRMVASQHMHLFVVLLFPARMFLLDAYSLISFQ